jgi:hypothetical protein
METTQTYSIEHKNQSTSISHFKLAQSTIQSLDRERQTKAKQSKAMQSKAITMAGK